MDLDRVGIQTFSGNLMLPLQVCKKIYSSRVVLLFLKASTSSQKGGIGRS